MEKSASFMNKLAEDKEMQAALMVASQTAVTKEEKIAATTKFANEAGFEVSADELQKFVESVQNTSDLLSDDDLDNVAGGNLGSNIGTVVGSVVGNAAGNFAGGEAAGKAGGALGALGGGALGGVIDSSSGKIANAAVTSANAVAHTAVSVEHKVAHFFHGW